MIAPALPARAELDENTNMLPFLAALVIAAPEASAARGSVADLAWMAGHWTGGEEGQLSEEVWTEPSGDCMLGMWRYVAGGRLKVYESLALVADGDGVVMRLRHFNPDGVGWEEKERPLNLRLVRNAEREAAFEGPGRKDAETVRITYRRTGTDSLVSVLEKWLPGQSPSRTDFVFKRKGSP
jgi:hypothetical protein